MMGLFHRLFRSTIEERAGLADPAHPRGPLPPPEQRRSRAIGGICESCGRENVVARLEDPIAFGEVMPEQAARRTAHSWRCGGCGESLIGVLVVGVSETAGDARPG
jgi:ribosomal protein L34E